VLLPIEPGIPLPTPKTKPRIYPFAEMKEGDSFFLAVEAQPAHTYLHRRANKQKRMASVLRSARVRAIGRFVARQVEGGVRVWRMS
jgi:hypothetical protein